MKAILEQAPGGRVTNMAERYNPPVITTAFKQSTQNATHVMHNLWPLNVHERAQGDPAPQLR